MSLQAHLETLQGKHQVLENQIAVEDQRPQPDTTTLFRLKREKLRLKEEMERLKAQ